MEKYDVKAEERKKFLKSFLVWMILAGIALIAFLVVLVTRKPEEVPEIPEVVRNNDIAPVERVYDYAEVLSDQEETDLRNLIADYEERSKCDLILVTIDQAVGLSDEEWTNTMVNLADDFYDQKAFGYDQPHGDGALLMDNWYHAGQDDSHGFPLPENSSGPLDRVKKKRYGTHWMRALNTARMKPMPEPLRRSHITAKKRPTAESDKKVLHSFPGGLC